MSAAAAIVLNRQAADSKHVPILEMLTLLSIKSTRLWALPGEMAEPSHPSKGACSAYRCFRSIDDQTGNSIGHATDAPRPGRQKGSNPPNSTLCEFRYILLNLNELIAASRFCSRHVSYFWWAQLLQKPVPIRRSRLNKRLTVWSLEERWNYESLRITIEGQNYAKTMNRLPDPNLPLPQ